MLVSFLLRSLIRYANGDDLNNWNWSVVGKPDFPHEMPFRGLITTLGRKSNKKWLTIFPVFLAETDKRSGLTSSDLSLLSSSSNRNTNHSPSVHQVVVDNSSSHSNLNFPSQPSGGSSTSNNDLYRALNSHRRHSISSYAKIDGLSNSLVPSLSVQKQKTSTAASSSNSYRHQKLVYPAPVDNDVVFWNNELEEGDPFEFFDVESYLAGDRIKKGQDAYAKTKFNQAASDKLSIDRPIPDTRNYM